MGNVADGSWWVCTTRVQAPADTARVLQAFAGGWFAFVGQLAVVNRSRAAALRPRIKLVKVPASETAGGVESFTSHYHGASGRDGNGHGNTQELITERKAIRMEGLEETLLWRDSPTTFAPKRGANTLELVYGSCGG